MDIAVVMTTIVEMVVGIVVVGIVVVGIVVVGIVVVGILVVGIVVLAHDGVDMMVVKIIPWNGQSQVDSKLVTRLFIITS